jgi:G3E family GTPase
LLDGGPARTGATGVPGARHSDFGHVSVVGGIYQLEPLEDLLEELPLPVFRAKGIVHLASGKWAGFHAVGGRLQLDPDVPAPPHRESRMVFFGRGIDEAGLRGMIAETSTTGGAPRARPTDPRSTS